jgi:hypothetical protein
VGTPSGRTNARPDGVPTITGTTLNFGHMVATA